MFTTQHYKVIAEVISTLPEYEGQDLSSRDGPICREDCYLVLKRLVSSLSQTFAYDNPKFNKSDFKKACGY